jgi:hypothetical protein
VLHLQELLLARPTLAIQTTEVAQSLTIVNAVKQLTVVMEMDVLSTPVSIISVSTARLIASKTLQTEDVFSTRFTPLPMQQDTALMSILLSFQPLILSTLQGIQLPQHLFLVTKLHAMLDNQVLTNAFHQEPTAINANVLSVAVLSLLVLIPFVSLLDKSTHGQTHRFKQIVE